MSEKKRKRTSETVDRPGKKVAVDAPPSVVKVSVVANSDEWTPVIGTSGKHAEPAILTRCSRKLGRLLLTSPASTPGLSLPTKISFQPYRKTQRNGSIRSTTNRSRDTSELLLHSSTHPKIDYTGREEDGGGGNSVLKHYVGVYDPKTGELQVMPARKLVVRGSVRHKDPIAAKDTGGDNSTESAPKVRFPYSCPFRPSSWL